MERGHYNGYRGRSGMQKVLTAIVGVLAALVVLLALVLLLGQQYIYYGADGVHLDLPFFKREPAPAPDVDQVIVEILPPAPKQPEPVQQEDGAVSDSTPVPSEVPASGGQTDQTE